MNDQNSIPDKELSGEATFDAGQSTSSEVETASQTCWKCGAESPGRFCSACGAELKNPDGAAIGEQGSSPRSQGIQAGKQSRGVNSKFLLLCGVILIPLFVIAFLLFGSGGGGHDIHGSMTLSDINLLGSSSISESDGHCYGTGGYDDMREGAQVVVKDASGKVIATGALEPGVVPTLEDDSVPVRGIDPWFCAFNFTVHDVPEVDFYSIGVSHRGELSFSRQELEQQDWTVEFSLG